MRTKASSLVVFFALWLPLVSAGQTGAPPKFDSLFDGTTLNGWIQDPPNGWTVKNGAMASLGTGRGTIYTTGNYGSYRLLFTMRHVSGKPDHQACVLIFCNRPPAGEKGLDALGGVQFQVPNGGHWDYRPGHNNSGKDEFAALPHPKFDPHDWSRVELLVDASAGTARMAIAQPVGSQAVEVLDLKDPAAGRTGPIAWQMHNAGLWDEYKDIEIEVNPRVNDLITTRVAAPTTAPPASARSGFKSLRTYLLPAVRNGGFQMNGYMIWCSSVIKVGDTYQMFASRWPAQYGLAGWTRYSECVRAASTNLFGPYRFQQVVLQKRPGHWDNSRVHNVKILKAGSAYVIYYINSANETGYAVADSITGPWTRCNQPILHASNPAPLVRPDLSVYVFCRLRDSAGLNRGVAFRAPSYRGPYTAVSQGDNLLPDGDELEDPTIWWADNQYNILVNDWQSHATGVFKAGAQYYSKDGVRYQLVSHQPVFTKTVVFDDGTAETFLRRERPFVYVNGKGEAMALFTACLPEHGPSRVVVQPINRYYPDKP